MVEIKDKRVAVKGTTFIRLAFASIVWDVLAYRTG